MPFLDPKQPAFFSIHSLQEVPMLVHAHHNKQEIVEIYLVSQGRVTIPGKDYRVSLGSNHLYCTRFNRQEGTAITEDTRGYLIRFNKALLYSSDHAVGSPSFPDFQTLVLRAEVLAVDASFVESAATICELMLQEHADEQTGNKQILAGLFSILLLHIMRKWNAMQGKTEQGERHSLLHKFNVLLEEKFKTNKKVSDYAALLFVTPSYLSDIIRQETGNSASFHIRQRVVWEAERQVRLTGASMKEVAWSLGFNDNAHFSKFFKKVAGRNFSEMRK